PRLQRRSAPGAGNQRHVGTAEGAEVHLLAHRQRLAAPEADPVVAGGRARALRRRRLGGGDTALGVGARSRVPVGGGFGREVVDRGGGVERHGQRRLHLVLRARSCSGRGRVVGVGVVFRRDVLGNQL